MKKLTFFLSVTTLVTGCATVGDRQAKCEIAYPGFVEMVDCLQQSIANDTRLKNNPRVKLYSLKAQQLQKQVMHKAIDEGDAKLALQELYVRLKSQETTEALLEDSLTPRSIRTNCISSGNVTQCQSR